MNDRAPSLVTVVISTRDRGECVVRTIRNLLASEEVAFELIVVDQSEDDRTREAVRPLLDDPRVRYLRNNSVGLANGRNLGIETAKTDLIAVTDDDCEIPPDWLRKLVAAFAVDPGIGVVFGNVVRAPHDERSGFITGYVRSRPFLARNLRDKLEVEGIAACLGFHKRVWKTLSGFDRMLGVGARLRSGEEIDFSIRALEAGYFVFETPEVTVVHHGFCLRERRREVIRRNWYGTGAVYGKYLKLHPLSTTRLLARLAGRFVLRDSRVSRSLGGSSHRLLRLAAFLRGLAIGILTHVDRRTGHFAGE